MSSANNQSTSDFNTNVHTSTRRQRDRDIMVLTETRGTTKLSPAAEASTQVMAPSYFQHLNLIKMEAQWKVTIKVIYSSHHGCCGNSTFNTLTSVKTAWIPIARASACEHIQYISGKTERPLTLSVTRTHTKDCAARATRFSQSAAACVTHFIWHIHRAAWAKSIALKYELNSFALK